MVYVVFTNPW